MDLKWESPEDAKIPDLQEMYPGRTIRKSMSTFLRTKYGRKRSTRWL
jgi:hypothetical protein